MRANSFQNFQKQIGTFLFRNLNRIFGQGEQGIAIFSHSVSAVNTCILVFYSKEQQGIRNVLYYLNENQLMLCRMYDVQGDPNQNFPFPRPISLKVSTSDPKLVKPKLVGEVAVFSQH